MMSQQSIYSIQLLNDLHNYFPEILYNPDRFHNIQDVLGYIRSIAHISPYSRGLNQYNSRLANNRVGIPFQSVNLNRVNSFNNLGEQTSTINGLDNRLNRNIPIQPQQTIISMINEISPDSLRIIRPVENSSTLMNTILGGLFGDILGTTNMQSFLDERVTVAPTNDEISNASTVFRAEERQDDICTICQDNIEANHNVRRLTRCTHYFHQDCIDTWFRGNVHCPTCRDDIRDINRPPSVPENHRRTNIRGE
jgi:hypothetical protein